MATNAADLLLHHLPLPVDWGMRECQALVLYVSEDPALGLGSNRSRKARLDHACSTFSEVVASCPDGPSGVEPPERFRDLFPEIGCFFR